MKSKKLLSVLLCTALLTAAFSGCGQTSNDSSSSDSSSSDSSASTGSSDAASTTGEESSTDTGEPEPLTLPISEDGAELDVYAMYGGTIMSDLNEIAGVKKAEEMTGVHINWIPVSLEEVNDKMGIMLSSGDYPDIIYPGVLYPGGVEAGIEEGVIYPDHDTLIRQYMPNYMAYLESNEEGRREATADSGKMLVVKCIIGQDFTAESEGTYQGLAYRKDLLEGLGIDEPTTVDEWHDALVAAKESGIEYPFMLEETGGSPLSLAWGVVTGMPNEDYVQMDGDTVVGAPLQPGFSEYIDTMAQWYAEGLIDPNFTSFNYYLDTPSSVENNQQLLYSIILSGFTGNNYYSMRMTTNENAYLQPIVAPVINEGDTVYQNGERAVAGDIIFISTSCEDPVLAAKWLDFQYSKEGELLNWYGIEGESYVLDENGEPQISDQILSAAAPSDELQKYALDRGQCWLGKNNWQAGNKLSVATSGSTQQMDAVAVWSAPEINLSTPSRGWTLNEEEGDIINSEGTAVTTLIQEYVINRIIGADTTPYEEFKEQLISYGYEDVIAAYQAAYDRYMAR